MSINLAVLLGNLAMINPFNLGLLQTANQRRKNQLQALQTAMMIEMKPATRMMITQVEVMPLLLSLKFNQIHLVSCQILQPPVKYTKYGHECDELTTKMLSMMETEPKEDDEIEVAMGAIAKHLQKGLQEDKINAAVDELNEVVVRHLHQSRERKAEYKRPSPVATATAPVPPPPPAYMQLPQMPPLQRLDQLFTYDAMSNTTFQNL